jgi:cytoskeleton protein RodZ
MAQHDPETNAAKRDIFLVGGDKTPQHDHFPAIGPNTVGGELRAARNARGLTLEAVSEDLKIRKDYLSAIERGDDASLPGLPYALGFVRSYARSMGLDAADLVSRYKAEAAAADADPALAFPQPVRQGRMPGIAFVALSLLLAAVVYGGWYLYSTYAETPGDGPAEAKAPPKVEAKKAPPKAGGPKADTPKADTPKAGAPKPKTPQKEAKTPPAGGKSADSASNVAAKPAAKPAPKEAQKDVVKKPAAKSVEPGAKKAKSNIVTMPAGTRVLLRARDNTWIQLRDVNNTVIANRVLAKGATFPVPNRKGLRLNIGRAGLLDIILDGRVLPPLRNDTLPAFNILMDPDALAKRR